MTGLDGIEYLGHNAYKLALYFPRQRICQVWNMQCAIQEASALRELDATKADNMKTRLENLSP